jgi:hypothetical protein
MRFAGNMLDNIMYVRHSVWVFINLRFKIQLYIFVCLMRTFSSNKLSMQTIKQSIGQGMASMPSHQAKRIE